jgi:hypothetical protein
VSDPGPVYRTITAYLDEIGWQYAEVGDEVTVALSFQGSEHEWRCVAQALEGRSIALFYSLAPGEVPEGRRSKVAELVARANYGMLEGAFELNVDDGELRFRTSAVLGRLDGEVDFAPGGLASSLVAEAVEANVFTMDVYLGAFVRVVAGEATPEEAIKQVES